MFQEMINGSVAVLTKPSVSTFEEHEKNNLAWALIYAVIAAVINAIITVATAPLRAGQLRSQYEGKGMDPAQVDAAVAASSGGVTGAIIGALIGTIIGSLIYWGIVYGLGRAFGGTGAFGELAWDLALFSAPLSIISTLLGAIPVVGGILAFAASMYGLYLTYLAIQSGMNLPSNKALYVILILFLILLGVFCFIFGAAFLALMGAGALQTAP
jgi:MFS family permease